MNISSVGNAYSNLQPQATQQVAQASKAGGDNDGDSDRSGSKAVQAAPAPTVNMNGQKIGSIINVTA